MKGKIAQQYGYDLELTILKSNAGFYVGTSKDYMPVSRESVEYYKTKELAQTALDTGTFKQRTEA
ncbi:hypothetical protein SAMN05660964_03800 [Thiothrix caldifontis]|uniref:Uncharacterized protein n=1 Tax=Thiothrix caldifontis TaxID=525918 RepID=A0A1H4GXG6_9GAMM|nr:hypothetical protein [Thiothrix caldifontis]SEB14329.1 hypothetical protein SAMN05660964_03800 [Thiothrix caldifontis]